MSSDDHTSQDQDDSAGAAIALLRATFSGDQEGAEMMMQGADPWPVLAAAVGMARQLGVRAYGADRFCRMLAAWRPGTRLGDDLGPNDDLDRFPDARDLWVQVMRLDRTRLEMVHRALARRLEEDL